MPLAQLSNAGDSTPVHHFPVHLGLHYAGGQCRYQAPASTSLSLTRKHLLMTTPPLALCGPRFQRLARWRLRPQKHVLLSDGDEGLRRPRQQLFPQADGLLDRWHLSNAARIFTDPDQTQFPRLMQPLWQADSQAALQALNSSPLRPLRPQACITLWGYSSDQHEGIDAWRRIPAGLRPGRTPRPPAVKSGCGAVEKSIEVQLDRRFQGHGRSWHPERAEPLLALNRQSTGRAPAGLGRLVGNYTPIPYQTAPALIGPPLTVDEHYQFYESVEKLLEQLWCCDETLEQAG